MFQFKQFGISDQRCGMKLGTDSVALGAWVDAEGCRSALDIGAGSGVLSLMLAQRYPEMQIEAVELDANATLDCKDNFAASKWADSLNVECKSFELHEPKGGAVDLIISNPPYFKNGQQAPEAMRAAARHEGTLCYASLLKYASRWLGTNGSVAMVLPAEFLSDCEYQALLQHLHLRRLTYLGHREGKAPKRILVQFTRTPGPTKRDTLYVQSDQFRKLTEPFYL